MPDTPDIGETPDTGDNPNRRRVAPFLQRAVAFHRAGELEPAGKLYEEILKIEPDHADATHNLGAIEIRTGHAVSGMERVQAAIDIDPTNGTYLETLVTTLLLAGRKRDALVAIRNAARHKMDQKGLGRCRQLVKAATAGK